MTEKGSEVRAATPATPTTVADWAAADWEAAETPGRRWLNEFCENWLFAICAAFAFRYALLEFYQIPSTSMEPVLIGDTRFLEADKVVVDKFAFRLTGPDRWDVTVFQFPWPRLQGGAAGLPAWDATGQRLDSFPGNPQLYPNFVKRCVGLPGDRMYIRGGDVYLQDDDGNWDIPAKPAHIQEALWQDIYRSGGQLGYLPWSDDGTGATVRDEGGLLQASLRPGSYVRLTQPLNNLYVKPGPVAVLPLRNGRPVTNGQEPAQVDVSMTAPQFHAHGKTGSIYDLRQWLVMRLTSADLDNKRHGRDLNRIMNEALSDIGAELTISSVQGTVLVELAEGPAQGLRLAVGEDDRWRVEVQRRGQGTGADWQQIAEGTGVRATWAMNWLDDRCQVLKNGQPVTDLLRVAPADTWRPESRLHVRLRSDSGGDLQASLRLRRDVHYSTAGILADETLDVQSQPAPSMLAFMIEKNRLAFIDALLDQGLADDMRLSLANGSGRWLLPLMNSPETAIQIPEGGYLLLGDNSPFSWDGRSWGLVPEANLRGSVFFRLYPNTGGVK
jgi:signal peptidase I